MKMKIKCLLLLLLLAEFCPPGLAQPKKANSATGAETLSAGWRQGEGESLFIIFFVVIVLGVATGTCYTILDFMKKSHETADEASEGEGDPQEREERMRHDEFMQIVPGISSTVVLCTTTREMILYWICDIPIFGPVPIEFTLQSYICSMLLNLAPVSVFLAYKTFPALIPYVKSKFFTTYMFFAVSMNLIFVIHCITETGPSFNYFDGILTSLGEQLEDILF